MASKLNYNKWDRLELSDDSDIEVHPNIDHKSMVRWKQREIHEKREARKHKIAALKSEIEMNAVLRPRMENLVSNTSSEGLPYVERQTSELTAKTKQDGGKGERPSGSKGPSYDEMMLSLLVQVVKAGKDKGLEGDELVESLVKGFKDHVRQLDERTHECEKEIEQEEDEQKKKITSEDIHIGFDSGHVNKTPSAIEEPKKTKKSKEKSIEVINPGSADKGKGKAVEVAAPVKNSAQPDQSPGYDSDASEEESLPELTPAAIEFSKIPLNASAFEKSFEMIQHNPSLLRSDTTDALLVEAFNAAMRGDKKYARQCIHQGLSIQYCRQMGKDGVALFYRRLNKDNPAAIRVFTEDVEKTFNRIVERAATYASQPDTEENREAIQLVATDPSTTISFEVPDGPPPEHLTIEGEGAEELDVEQVREFLQRKWDIFQSFPKNLRKALETRSLDEVNKVLEKMQVDEATEIVRKLDEGGILSFQSSEILEERPNQEGADPAGAPSSGPTAAEKAAAGAAALAAEID